MKFPPKLQEELRATIGFGAQARLDRARALLSRSKAKPGARDGEGRR